jgi:transposase
MSLLPTNLQTIPAETRRVAQAAFPKGNLYLRLRDELGPLYEDEAFTDLFPSRGRPAESPGRLALITIFQFAEGLSDRAAAQAVQSRIDWKYALGLELTDAGFDASVLVEFRARLVASDRSQRLFDLLLARLREAKLGNARGRQRTDSTHVLAAVQALHRLECVGETLRHTLDTLARVAPDWLRAQAEPDWWERYGRRFEDSRLPTARTERYALAEQIGQDGHHLLRAMADQAPDWLRQIPAVETLRQVWVQQFHWSEGVLRWREAGNLPPASRMIYSPYDVEARYGKKRDAEWKGYKVPLTECCDPDLPLVITDVQTTSAAATDFEMLPTVQVGLAERNLLPHEHLVDSGYMSAAHIVVSQREHSVQLLGPVLPDPSWRTKTNGAFGVAAFTIDWENRTAHCPQGATSVSWLEGHNAQGHDIVQILFDRQTCAACPARAHCTRSVAGPRTLRLSAQPQHEALQRARQREKTEEFQKTYAQRAGVEGTISQGVRMAGLRRARYVGLAKTRLQHLATAAALNGVRVGAWFLENVRAKTRRSAFAALAPQIAWPATT